MRRVCLLLAVTLLATLALAGSAHAAKRLSAAQVAKALTTNHAFVQPGSKPPPDRAALNAVAAANPSFYLVVLSRRLIGAPTAKAAARLLTQALQPTNPQATVGVIQGGKLGGASLSYPQERIDKAVADSGLPTLGAYFASLDPEVERIRDRWLGRAGRAYRSRARLRQRLRHPRHRCRRPRCRSR